MGRVQNIFICIVNCQGIGTDNLLATWSHYIALHCLILFRFGGMLAPWVELLGKHYHPYIPAVVFGSNAVVAGLAAVLLPDTQHRDRASNEGPHEGL